MEAKFTLKDFKAAYPTDAACLDKIWHVRFGFMEDCPNCNRPLAYRRVRTRRSYQCRHCYHQIYPTAGTVFDKTTTPLIYWFYAIFLMTTTRNGVAAKELERLLGVTYKTAFRMVHQIRMLMAGDSKMLEGFVEIDETFISGKNKNKHFKNRNPKKRGRSKEQPAVIAMVERLGEVRAKYIERIKKETVLPWIEQNVSKDAKISTDELPVYTELTSRGYDHGTVNHRNKQYRYDYISVNNLECYFSQLKRMIYGTHLHVSRKYLQNYVNECSFRYNHRNNANQMFEKILENLPSA